MEDRITQDSVAQPQVAPQAPISAQPEVTQAPVNTVPPVTQATVAPVQPEAAQTVPQPVQTMPVEGAAPQQATPQVQPENLTPSEQQFVGPAQPQVAATNEAYREASDKKRHRMKAKLDAQEKVMTMVPLKEGEDPNSWQYVGINGYPVWIKKGVFVSVPKQVAKILADSYGLTYAIGQEHLISARQDRLDALK